jgi:hypothetical protein
MFFEEPHSRTWLRQSDLPQSLVYIEIAFIFSKVTNIMALRQNTPHFGPKTQGVLERLKNNIPITRPITLPA